MKKNKRIFIRTIKIIGWDLLYISIVLIAFIIVDFGGYYITTLFTPDQLINAAYVFLVSLSYLMFLTLRLKQETNDKEEVQNKTDHIPITDESLLRLGFYDDRGRQLRYELPDGFCILYLKGNLELFGTEEDSMRLPYQYIHQVQNLIHSLTGNMPSL